MRRLVVAKQEQEEQPEQQAGLINAKQEQQEQPSTTNCAKCHVRLLDRYLSVRQTSTMRDETCGDLCKCCGDLGRLYESASEVQKKVP